RIDTDWIDPLELNAGSRLGVPGMLEAVRAGNVALANMPGSGLAEARALLGFLPGLSRRLTGRDLLLPNIATWWCGQQAERDEVLGHLDDFIISGAFGEFVPGFPGRRSLLPADLDGAERARLEEGLRTRGIDYVGQEVVRLSTTPVWEEGRLVPRPFVLRVYAAATPSGWHVMPGGLCRVSDQPDVRAVSMSGGVQSADVWVLADKPVEATTLLPGAEEVKIVRLLGNLPSRAADNLLWLGRYLERAEATLRLVRCLCARAIDADAPLVGSSAAAHAIERLQRLLAAWGAVPADMVEGGAAEIAAAALQAPDLYGSALSIARLARQAASVIRERLSLDAWRLVGRLEMRVSEPMPRASEAEILERVENALASLAALAGLINENINRVAGWNFLDMGRRLERAINTCRFARQFADRDATAENLDVLLDLIDSQITYRSRYMVGVALAPVRDMALLDPYNPRSVCFQVQRISEHLAGLPVLREDGILEAPQRQATRLAAELTIELAEDLDTQKIFAFEQRLAALADAIATRYFLQAQAHSGQTASTL
ncbi:MAG: hypothetical protein B7Z80_26490, partial [Rhodospirillales bacterium 20-64-7]